MADLRCERKKIRSSATDNVITKHGRNSIEDKLRKILFPDIHCTRRKSDSNDLPFVNKEVIRNNKLNTDREKYNWICSNDNAKYVEHDNLSSLKKDNRMSTFRKMFEYGEQKLIEYPNKKNKRKHGKHTNNFMSYPSVRKERTLVKVHGEFKDTYDDQNFELLDSNVAWVDSDDEKSNLNLHRSGDIKKARCHYDEICSSEYASNAKLNQPSEISNIGIIPYRKAVGTTWVENAMLSSDATKLNISSESDSDIGFELFKTTNDLIDKSNDTLVADVNVSRLKNVNYRCRSKSVVRSLQFHPRKSILFTAGYDKTLRLFDVNGYKDKLIQSVYFENFPIGDAKFDSTGNKIFLLGPKKTIAVFDLFEGKIIKIPGIGGRMQDSKYYHLCFNKSDINPYFALSTTNGYVVVCDCRTNSLVRSLKMNADVTGMEFHPTRGRILTTDREANIYDWDIADGRCIDVFFDESSLRITAATVSTTSPFLFVTGSRYGFTNIFSFNQAGNLDRKPLKILSNLTTEITDLSFHKSARIMSFSSRWMTNAIRLFHVPSMSVCSKWPNVKDFLKGISATAFSDFGGFFAAGNIHGNVYLFKIRKL